MHEATTIKGRITWRLTAGDGSLVREGEVENLVTTIGDRMYAERGGAVSGAPAAPTGMKLGTGGGAPAKTGSGAALTTYLSNSHQGFESGYPQGSAAGSARRVSYSCVYGPGKGTSGSPVTEVVLVNESLTDATSAAGATIARALLSGIGSKGADQTLSITWTHDLLGA